jgi:hypothetical protein
MRTFADTFPIQKGLGRERIESEISYCCCFQLCLRICREEGSRRLGGTENGTHWLLANADEVN